MSFNPEDRAIGTWLLPTPDEIKKWSPVPILNKKAPAPFGYYKANEDDDFYTPNEFELEALELAKQHLKKYTYAEVSQWLSKQVGRKITIQMLYDRLKREQNRKKRLATYRRAAKRLTAFLKEAKRWEEKIALYSPSIEKRKPIEVYIPGEDTTID